MKNDVQVLLISCLAMLSTACSGDASCPAGSRKVGSRCVPQSDAGSPEGDADVERDAGSRKDAASAQGECGDGDLGEGEACDDGNRDDGDGCDRACEVEPSIDTPVIEAADSMAPGRELWTWSGIAGAAYYEVEVDGKAPEGPARRSETRFRTNLGLGEHTIRVRACSDDYRCSEWASRKSKVEQFGGKLPGALRDTARMLPATMLGHPVGIACNDCFNRTVDQKPTLDAALASISRAVTRGADIVELNVASIEGQLYAAPSDVTTKSDLPKLADLLNNALLTDVDAVIALEIVENIPFAPDAELPATFAQSLFQLLENNPKLVRNGRPLWLRAPYSSRGYLQALQAEAQNHAAIGPYVKFVVSDPGGNPEEFYRESDSKVASLEFADAVALRFDLPNLPLRLERARASGAAVVLEGVPGPGHGEVVLAALRESADAFITDYRVDQARGIVSEENTLGFFDPRSISADGRTVSVQSLKAGVPSSTLVDLGAPIAGASEPSQVFTPTALLRSEGTSLAGSYLKFDDKRPQSLTIRASPDLPPSEGFVCSSLVAVGRRTESSGDFALFSFSLGSRGSLIVLTGDDGDVTLWGTASDGRSLYRSLYSDLNVPICQSKNGSQTGQIDISVPHWYALYYHYPTGYIYLFVDGRCAGAASLGAVRSTLNVYLGYPNGVRMNMLYQQVNLFGATNTDGHGEN